METAPNFRNKKKKLSSLVYVLHKISRRIRAVTAKKCTKKCDARAKLHFHLLKLFSFFDVLATDMKVVEPTKKGHQRDKPKYHMHKETYKETI